MLSSTAKELYFRRAVNQLAKYNGLHTLNELAGAMRLQQVSGENNEQITVPTANDIEKQLIALFVDTSEGSITTYNLIRQLEDLLSEAPELRDQLLKTFQIYYTKDVQGRLTKLPPNETTDILEMLGYASGQTSSTNINSNASNPTKHNPGLSVILSNSHRVGLIQRDTNPSVLFLNSIPNVEMCRATPFVDILFSLGRPAKNTQTGQVQSLSLTKFLVGAVKSESGTPLDDMLLANQTSGNGNTVAGTATSTDTTRSLAGMELFTSPQTLVNANERDNPTLRGQAILDKNKPLLSINDLSITIVPSTGLMAFKTADLSLTLHDRSRLSEVADFVRADLYGLTEITIEYGWLHPDGNTVSSERNPYGDLINGMRMKEKFSIINSSFSMTDTGEISIKLQLAMRGSEAFATELISSDSDGTGNAIRDVQELVESITELRSRVFGGGTGFQTREIRGVQILDAAQDALNNTTFGSDLQEALRDFRAGLQDTQNPEARTLLKHLNNLYNTVRARGGQRQNGRGGNRSGASSQSETYLSRLRRSVQDSVREKMLALSTRPDPFLVLPSDVRRGRVIQANGTQATNNEIQRIRQENSIQGVSEGATSLAKLLLLFIGQPLALTGKFDDVQLVFYPFNAYAGQASNINIGNFAIDNQYFAENFARWRLDRIGRSANVNLQDFIGFLATTLIDDPAATSYGLYEGDKSLFREVITDTSGQAAIGAEALDDPADHITKLERILRNVTPDGTFRMPQIDFYLETTPEKMVLEDNQDASQDSGRSILRVHVFDRVASSYDTLGALMANTRNTELSAIGQIGQPQPVAEGESVATSNPGVNESRVRLHNTFISAAESANIIETVPGTGTTSSQGGSSSPVGKNESDRGPQMYRIKGGSRAMKNFLYNTTPHIVYGTIGSTIKTAQLSSQQDPALSTINLLRSFRRSEIEPNGENPGGIPLRVIPTELNISSLGCPLVHFAQQYFVDFNTGTTADNFYGISGITHNFTQGDFTTGIKFAPMDAYGRYIGIIEQVRNAQAVLQDIEDSNRAGDNNTSLTD